MAIRQAILMNRDPGDIDSDEEYEEECNRSERSAYAQSERIAAAAGKHKMSLKGSIPSLGKTGKNGKILAKAHEIVGF